MIQNNLNITTMKRYMLTVSCDPYHANMKYHGEEIIRYDGKTPIEWIVDRCANLTIEEAHEKLEKIVERKDTLSYYDKHVFETEGEEIPEWFNGDGYYDDERCVYNIGDKTYRDDVLYYSIEEIEQ
nr:MAG TPA: hypothetical protein [Caudoviricetes sp.]